jgi:hypothetical protein
MARHLVLSIEPALALAKPVAPSECMLDSATRPPAAALEPGQKHLSRLNAVQPLRSTQDEVFHNHTPVVAG